MKKKIITSTLIFFIFLSRVCTFAAEDTSSTYTYNREEQKVLSNIPTIGCKAVYIADPITGKVFYEKNAHEKMYPASTTKILTALVVLENCKLEDIAVISKNAIDLVSEGYSNANLVAGEELTILDLLYALLVPSANEAANALAEHVSGSIEEFAKLCNNRAKELGCEGLHFVNPNGIHDDDHYCTAYDLYLIAKECKKYDVFNEIVKTTEYTLPATNNYKRNDRILKTTNELLSGSYYYEPCTGIKTGYTTPAGQCLVASCINNEIELISVVLGGGTNSRGYNERFYDTKELFNFIYDNYSIKEIVENNYHIATLNVGKATSETASLDVDIETSISAIIPNDINKEDINIEVLFDENIAAPIKQNQVLGHANIHADGLVYTASIIATHDVDKLPYGIYNTIVVVAIILTLFIFIKLLKKTKKHRKSIFIVGLIVLVIEGCGVYLIMRESEKNLVTKTTYLSSRVINDEVQNRRENN